MGVLGLAILALAGGQGLVRAGAAAAGEVGSPPLNDRWSGYVVTAASFTHVAGTWTEPAVTCVPGAEPALSTVWVGLGGYSAGSSVLDQIGAAADCATNGRASYSAWFELLPDVAHPIAKPLRAGDTMTASVEIDKANLVELTLRDLTRGWRFAAAIQVGIPDRSSAEWVVEAPYSCRRFDCHQAPLADFGTVAIRDVSATGDVRQGTLADASWKRASLRAAPCARASASKDAATGSAAALPGPPSPDGTAFNVVWVPRAGSPRCGSASAGGVPDVTLD